MILTVQKFRLKPDAKKTKKYRKIKISASWFDLNRPDLYIVAQNRGASNES